MSSDKLVNPGTDFLSNYASRAAKDLMSGMASPAEIVMISTMYTPVAAAFFLIHVHDFLPYSMRRDLDHAIKQHVMSTTTNAEPSQS